ncbi:Citrate transporter [Carnimonas sp. R-84865]
MHSLIALPGPLPLWYRRRILILVAWLRSLLIKTRKGAEKMLTIVGLAIIAVIVAALLTEKLSPVVALSVVPVIGALIAGFSLSEIGEFFEAGIGKVANVAFMFMFAVLFFSIMKDSGVFDPIVNGVIKLTRGNVILVAMMTPLLAAIVHLDGSGAATFLIIIPALLPLYQRLGMRPVLMLMLAALSMGVMNMVPWGGPIGRAAAVTGVSPTALWHDLLPVQLLGVAGAMVVAAAYGYREQRLIKRNRVAMPYIDGQLPIPAEAVSKVSWRTGFLPNLKRLQRRAVVQYSGVDMSTPAAGMPRHFWPNVVLILIVIALLANGVLPPALVFMLALSLCFAINVRKPSDQAAIIKRHAPQAFNMGAIIAAAGVFLGILDKGGMLSSIARDITSLMPAEALGWVHVVVGIFGVPLDMLTSTDAYYFAILPVVQEITSPAGIDAKSVVYALAIGNNAGTFVSPFAPAVWLAVGLSGVSMGKHLKFSFPIVWLFSLYLLLLGGLMGLYF